MKIDPINVEVIRHLLEAASRDIRRVVERAAYSPILYEVIDFSCAILDAEAKLIAETPGLPIFLANLGYSVKATYDTIGRENLHPGDVILCNDPYNGGYTHCPDIVLLCPTFVDGEIISWAGFRGHTVDMGGIHPGGWYPDTTEVFQEGLRIPPVKVWSKGNPNPDILNIIVSNSRVPDAVLGDIRAMIAGVRAGAKRINEIVEKYGLETTLGTMAEILEQGKKLGSAAIGRIPDGVYTAETILDGDGNDDAMLDRDVPIKMSITVKGEHMKIDFEGTGAQCNGPMNLPFPTTVSAVHYGFKIITSPNLPSNDGFFENLELVVPEKTLLNPVLPAACSQWPAPATTIPDMMIRAMAPAMPELVRAGHFGDSMAHFFFGVDPRSGVYYVSAEPDAGGYGAHSAGDGESALHSMALGDTLNLSAEVAEVRFPFRIERIELNKDSGGPGEYRGGLGTKRQYRILGHDAGMTVTADRVINTPPWGLLGGKSGTPSITRVYDKNSNEKTYRKISNLSIEKDCLISFEPGGGGGYGSPLKRDPRKVLQDVIEEYISLEKARDDYGVIIDPASMTVDEDETQKLRSNLN